MKETQESEWHMTDDVSSKESACLFQEKSNCLIKHSVTAGQVTFLVSIQYVFTLNNLWGEFKTNDDDNNNGIFFTTTSSFSLQFHKKIN